MAQGSRRDFSASGAEWSRTTFWWVLAIFVAAWVAFSLPWLSGRVTIPYDAKAHFQAQIQFLAQALHSGQSPFWTPNVFGGSPQIADPQSLIFSPAIILAWFVPNPSFRMVDGFVLGLLGLGGFAIVMLFKDRNWHPAGAMVAGLAFAFGGAAAWRIQHVGQILSFAQFGITLWLLLRALDRSSVRYGVLSGLSAAVMVNKPDQVALLGCYCLVAVVISHWLQAEDRRAAFVRSVRPLLAAGVVTVLVAGLPLLMTVLFVGQSQRAEIVFSEAVRGSLHPASLLTGLIADLFGAGDPKIDYWGPSSAAFIPGALSLAQNMGEVYFGILPVLAILTIGMTRGALLDREIRVYSLLLLAVILFALGKYTPVFQVFYHTLPGIKGFRRPADATFLIGGLGAIVGGYLVHRWMTARFERTGLTRLMIKGMVLTGAFALAVGLAVYLGHLGDAVRPLIIAASLSAAGLLLIKVLQAKADHAPVFASALLATFMVLDLGLNNGPNESTGLPPKEYDVLDPASKNSTLALIKRKLGENRDPARRDRVELVGIGFEWPNIGMIHHFDHVLGYNPLRLKEFAEASGAGDTIAGPDQRTFTPLMPSYSSLFADLIGLRWIASSVPIEQVDKLYRPGDLRFVARTEDAYVYENTSALPRALFVRGWKLADFEAMTETGIWPDFNPRQEVLLEAAPEDQRTATFSGPASVAIREYANTRVEIEVNSPDAGFLVLNDVWHNWWRASIDGEEVDILKANVLFRAVQIEAGKHTVVFEFKPIEGALVELRERLTGETYEPDLRSHTP